MHTAPAIRLDGVAASLSAIQSVLKIGIAKMFPRLLWSLSLER